MQYRNLFTFFQCTCLFHNKIISTQHLTYSLYSYVSITMMINSSAPINLYRMVHLNNLILCFRNIHFQLAAVKQCFFLSSSSLFFFPLFSFRDKPNSKSVAIQQLLCNQSQTDKGTITIGKPKERV